MGKSHARAYHQIDDYEIVGLVSRGPSSREALSKELGGLPTFDNFDSPLAATQPDVVSINTYPEWKKISGRLYIKGASSLGEVHRYCSNAR